VQYQLKTPYRDGTTHVFFEPLDCIARLAALVPKPRVNLTRFHGVFAPNSHRRAQVVPGRRNGHKAKAPDAPDPARAERRASMTWAQRRCSAWRKHQGSVGRNAGRGPDCRKTSAEWAASGYRNRAPFAVRVG
jgi:hypothetical protein